MAKTLAEILLGEDMEGGEVFCDDIYNNLKNHWRADYTGDPCAVLTEQLGMVISDEHDDRLYHITTGPVCTEIVQGDIPLSDEIAIVLGTDRDGSIEYEETTNQALIFGIPVSAKRGLIICRMADIAVDFTPEITASAQPVFWFIDADTDSYLGVGHQADDRPGIWSGPDDSKVLAIQYEANADVTFFEGCGGGENRVAWIYGDDGGGSKWGKIYVDADGKLQILAEEETYIDGFLRASKTDGAWSKTIGAAGDYADWATMIADMPDLIAHAVTVEIEAGTTLTEICDLNNKHGVTVAGIINVQAEKYFPTAGAIPTADSATATTLRDAALAAAALGDDYFNGCWVFIVDVGTDNITGVTVGGAGAGEFKVAGDLTARYLAADVLIVKGSTNNDGYYTISAGGSVHAAGTTTIPVDEAVAAVADGTVQTQGVLDNGFVPITDYIDATGDVVVANWPAAQPIAGDRYIIVGALIDAELARSFGFDMRDNTVFLDLYGIGMQSATLYNINSANNSRVRLRYCGWRNSVYDGLRLDTTKIVQIYYCGVVGNNTINTSSSAGIVVRGTNVAEIGLCGISDNRQQGIYVAYNGFAEISGNFGDANGTWGTYCKYSGQSRMIVGTECSGSSGNHSDPGTAGNASADQASAY